MKQVMDPSSRHVIVLTSPEKSTKTTIEIIKQLTKKGNCIYLTFTKSSKELKGALSREKINLNHMGFIDATGMTMQESATTVCAPGPSALTEISIALTRLTDSGKYKYLYIDSLSALLVHNEPQKAQKFIQYIINKAVNMNLKIIIIAVPDVRSKETIDFLLEILDKQIKL